MTGFVPSLDLIKNVAAGEARAIGRLISRAEAGASEARPALAQIYRQAGNAHVIGITGVPGSGKSTMVATLVALLRANGAKVGVVAIDPSSPYSGGSILGDRIRMSEHVLDHGVFIRSMATRGAVGGLARAALEAVDVLEHGGFDCIIVETVGVGQDEVEIARASHTTVVVSAPGLGDDIQAIKAGMLEIADIHVVSKCDRSDANRTLTDLKHMMALGAATRPADRWRVPVLGVSSLESTGFDELITALESHRNHIFGTTEGSERCHSIAQFRLRKTAENLLLERFAAQTQPLIPDYSDALRDRQVDPYTAAEALLVAINNKD